MKDLPRVTAHQLKSVGIYRKMTPQERKILRVGAKVELEHTDNHLVAVKIANDHIFREKNKNYYKKLKKFVEK